ncbi:MAG: ABC transporter substrate-binding protein [Spirochaetaceae bacterium]|nr:ABC transporter substrate-binding protein [Spirochaetaceae bacterium]
MKEKAKKIRFLSILILLAAVIVLLVFVITKSKKPVTLAEEEPTKKLILGFSQIGSESAWRTRNTQSIFDAAAENDIQIIIHDAQQKQENQLKAIRSFIVYQVDVIAFVPIVEDGWENVLTEAKEAGIPVIVVDRQINADPSLYAGFLGENGVEEGRRAARFLLSKCRDKTEKVTIFEMSGTENSSIVKNRARGFREIINTDPKFQIIHTENGDFLRSRGKEICDVLLANNVRENGNTTNTLYFDGQKIDAVFSHNDSMTLGFLDSLQAHKVNAKNTIFITIDAEQESIDALKDGKLNCVVECNPNLGPMLMELVKQIAAGNAIPHITYNNETVFTEDDDFSVYEPRGY